MSRLNLSWDQFALVLRVLCAVAALAALALLAPSDWRAHFARFPAAGRRREEALNT